MVNKPEAVKILNDFIVKIGSEKGNILEQRFKIILAPKPWYLPKVLWLKIISKLLILEEYS